MNLFNEDKKPRPLTIDELSQLWFDMPEFSQGNRQAIKRVVINFESETDIDLFNKATGLKVTMKTKGTFFPPTEKTGVEYVEDN
tara:strand:- start:1996 stop:2247 length:252 start_codon:yes stop_codon:yes gene_type:complete